MSLHEYEVSRGLSYQSYPFYALIMAAMRQADTDNLEKLKAGWPETWDELQRRYNAPGGAITDEELHQLYKDEESSTQRSPRQVSKRQREGSTDRKINP